MTRADWVAIWIIQTIQAIAIAVLAYLLIGHSCFAADSSLKPVRTWLVSPGGVSWHPHNQDRRFNDLNGGLLVGYRYDDTHAIIGGVIRNSERNASAIALYRYTPIHVGPMRVGGYLGAATGYQRAPVVPCAGLISTIDVGPVELSLAYAPQVPRADFKGHVTLLAGVTF